MPAADAQERFQKALDALVAHIREDRTILAAILFGSLSHDTVWEKSDIDLILITQDDKKASEQGVALVQDGINIHAVLQTRSQFVRSLEQSLRSSFWHSSISLSTLLFTRDETLRELYEDIHHVGERDRQAQLLHASAEVIGCLAKAQKWFTVKKDLDYTILWLLSAVNGLARIETILHGAIVRREVIHQALAVNPAFFRKVYTDLIGGRKTRKGVGTALALAEGYLRERAPSLFKPVFAYLIGEGAVRSVTEIQSYFATHLNASGVTTICEWLADQGLIAKAASPVRLTRRSLVELQELAFYHEGES